MKVNAWWNWGYSGPWGIKSWRPYSRVCDELCNDVLQFIIPWVAGIEIRLKPKRNFSDGLWYSSGGTVYPREGAAILDVVTYGAEDSHVIAYIPMRLEEYEAAFDGDGVEHPKLYTDSEVLARASSYEIYSPAMDDFVPLLRGEVVAILDRPGRWA